MHYATLLYVGNKTIIESPPTIEPELTTNINTTTEEHSKVNEKYSELFMILAAVFLITSIITTAISLVLFWKLCFQKKKKEGTAGQSFFNACVHIICSIIP